MNRIDRAKAELKDTKRLLRNSDRRKVTLSDKLWGRRDRCVTCSRPQGGLVRNEDIHKKWVKEGAINHALWDLRYELRRYINACKLVDKGIPS